MPVYIGIDSRHGQALSFIDQAQSTSTLLWTIPTRSCGEFATIGVSGEMSRSYQASGQVLAVPLDADRPGVQDAV